MVRRRPPSQPGEETATRLPWEPGMTLCGERREAGWLFRHNVKPGTPMGRGFPLVWKVSGQEGASAADCGFLPLPRDLPSSPAFWAAVTLWRPIGPASHHQRGR